MSTTELSPRIPLFEGRSLRVFQEADFIGFRAAKGHAFTSSKRSGTLYLRDDSIESVAVVALQSPEWVALQIHGDFREGQLPDDITFAPVAADDAAAIVALLTDRLKLPRLPPVPEPIYPYRLTLTGPSQLAEGTCIRVVGQYRPVHSEGPNFEGAKLKGDPALLKGLIPGRRYAVTGIYDPGLLSRRTAGQALIRRLEWSSDSRSEYPARAGRPTPFAADPI